MSVEDIDGDGTHINELDPGDLNLYLLQAASDLEKQTRELLHADDRDKREEAQRLNKSIGEYVALCDRRALVRWDVWKRVAKLQELAKILRDLGETAEANRYAAQAQELIPQCFREASG